MIKYLSLTQPAKMPSYNGISIKLVHYSKNKHNKKANR